MANDRNLILFGYDSNWSVYDASGNELSTANNQVSAITKAIFKGIK
jgi:hypothetical protein